VGEGAVNVLVKWPDGSERRTTVDADDSGVVELEYARPTVR
jgi:hypothetical protein